MEIWANKTKQDTYAVRECPLTALFWILCRMVRSQLLCSRYFTKSTPPSTRTGRTLTRLGEVLWDLSTGGGEESAPSPVFCPSALPNRVALHHPTTTRKYIFTLANAESHPKGMLVPPQHPRGERMRIMRDQLTGVAILLAAATAVAQSAPPPAAPPAAGQGRPPMAAIGVPVAGMPFVHDPSTVVKFHGKYYVFSTGRGAP